MHILLLAGNHNNTPGGALEYSANTGNANVLKEKKPSGLLSSLAPTRVGFQADASLSQFRGAS